MKIFFSHSSHDKALIREIKYELPYHIKTWIDEDDLLIGENINRTLQRVIQVETDFVIIFFSKESMHSKWVRKEIDWALTQEKRQNRTIVIPVILERDIIQKIRPKQLHERKYLECFSTEKADVKAFAEKFYVHLIGLIIKDRDVKKSNHESDIDNPNESSFPKILSPSKKNNWYKNTIVLASGCVAIISVLAFLAKALFYSNDLMLLVGSGTVKRYLEINTPKLIDISNKQSNVNVLEVASGTAVKVLTNAFPDYPSEDERPFSLLILTSEQLPDTVFKKYEKSGFFEIFIGLDTLQVIIGAKDENTIKLTFGKNDTKDLISIPYIDDKKFDSIRTIHVDTLYKWVWVDSLTEGWYFKQNKNYAIRLTVPESATRDLFEKCLRSSKYFGGTNNQTFWVNDNYRYDVGTEFVKNVGTIPYIAFGSIYLNSENKSRLVPSRTQRIYFVRNHTGQLLTRG